MLEKHFGFPAERYQERKSLIILFFSYLRCEERPSEAARTRHQEQEAAVNGEMRPGLAEAEREAEDRRRFSWLLAEDRSCGGGQSPPMPVTHPVSTWPVMSAS